MQMVCMYAQAYRVKNRSLPHRQMVRARLSLAAEVRMCRLHQILVWVPRVVRRCFVCACVLRDRIVWCFEFYEPHTLQVWTREDLAESDAVNISAEADLIADEEAPQDQSELDLE